MKDIHTDPIVAWPMSNDALDSVSKACVRHVCKYLLILAILAVGAGIGYWIGDALGALIVGVIVSSFSISLTFRILTYRGYLILISAVLAGVIVVKITGIGKSAMHGVWMGAAAGWLIGAWIEQWRKHRSDTRETR